MEIEIIGAFIIGLTVALLIFLRAQHRHLEFHIAQLEDKLNEKENVPYALRNGLEDVLAPNADVRVMLQNLRAWKENYEYSLDRIELLLDNQANMVGQIRGGTYNKDQPASPRDSTTSNGDSR